MKKLAVFASGSGSNFEAIVKGQKNYEVVLLIVDKLDAYALVRARKMGIESVALPAKDFVNKQEHEEAIVSILKEYDIDFIALAGYMRLLGETLLNEYSSKIVNIHPSLLPNFKGKEAIKQAVEAGVDTIGVTVHWVDFGMDTGEIIEQKSFLVNKGESISDIENRVHEIEHILYPKVLNELLK